MKRIMTMTTPMIIIIEGMFEELWWRWSKSP
jgi:hypothetical protein